jgi:hypothetical protein
VISMWCPGRNRILLHAIELAPVFGTATFQCTHQCTQCLTTMRADRRRRRPL